MRAIRVLTDVATLEKEFDYLVEDDAVFEVGDQVRVPLHGRRVSGWITAEVAVGDRELKPWLKWLGRGPSAAVLDLARWSGRRWFASPARFLTTASSVRRVKALPAAPHPKVPEGSDLAPGLWRVGAQSDPLPLVLAAIRSGAGRDGSVLVLVPTLGWAERLASRLQARGLAVAQGEASWPQQRADWPVIVGTRGEAFAPCEKIAAAIVIDADDESYVSESSPTWHATVVVAERCRRDDAPLFLTSVMPSPLLRSLVPLEHEEAAAQTAWPELLIVDRRSTDPHDGVLSSEVLRACRTALRDYEGVAVAVVLQRLGAGRLLSCFRCGELMRCDQCGGPELLDGSDVRCQSCDAVRPGFCRSCGGTKMRVLRSGVTTLARDVAAQLGMAVLEVTAQVTEIPNDTRVVVGTEAIFRLVRRVGIVVFVDIDQYLLAPRERARRDAVLVVARAGRLVGSGLVAIQTRRSNDAVLEALRSGDVGNIECEDEDTARLLGLPPFRATATIGGSGGADFAASLREEGVRLAAVADGFVVDAGSHDELYELLARGKRPSKALRIAISP